MENSTHYLKKELYEIIQKDSKIFEFLQEGSLDGIWYWDIENPDHEWMSERFWKILGYNPEEKKHLSSEWQNLINPDDLQMALQNFEKHCKDPLYPYDQIVRYTHKNGSIVWIRCRGIGIRDTSGRVIRMLGAHIDVTMQKRAEEEIRMKTLELEKVNKELKKALENIKTLSGLLPICSHCKRIRDDSGYWKQLEAFIQEHSDADFSHSVCPSCLEKYYPEVIHTFSKLKTINNH